jgi:hypothetical protein
VCKGAALRTEGGEPDDQHQWTQPVSVQGIDAIPGILMMIGPHFALYYDVSLASL